jgi:hypothetical protein
MCALDICENVATVAQTAVSQPKLSKRPYSMHMPLQNLQSELPGLNLNDPACSLFALEHVIYPSFARISHPVGGWLVI